MMSFECDVSPRARASGVMRGSRPELHALFTMSTCSDGSQRVVIAHMTSARFDGSTSSSTVTTMRHVALRGGNQRGALGMPRVALPERDHRHELGDVLPGADDI